MAKFTGKNLQHSLPFNKVATLLKKRLSHRCFLLDFANFFRTSFYRTPLDDCFCPSYYLRGVFVTPLVESYRHRGISNILIWEGIVCSRPVNSTGAAERLRILIDFSNSPSLPSYSPNFTCSLTWNNLWLGNYFICFLKPVMINEIILRVRKNIVYPENIELKITVPNPGIAFIVYPLRFIQ